MNIFSAKSPFATGLATVIAAALLGLSGARAVNYWLQENNKPPLLKTGIASQFSAKSRDKRVDYEELTKLHLLGRVENNIAKKEPKKKGLIKAPETTLNLKLIGVLFDRDKEDGYAIISEAGKPQKAFHKGDKLYGNATLYDIEPNRVILKRNGRHEALTLKKPNLEAGNVTPVAANRRYPTPKRPYKRSYKNKPTPPPEQRRLTFPTTRDNI